MTLGGAFDSVLAAARTGSEWAWRRIYDDLAPVVLGYLRGHGAPEPEDLLSEVFLRVARSLETFTGDEAGFRSWVFTIAHHRLVDEQRKRGRLRVTAIDDEAEQALPTVHAETEALDALTTTEVVDLLRRVLTDEQRDVLLLRLVAGLTIAEVAEVVGRTENATKALQRRGLRSLRRHVEAMVDDPYPYGAAERSQE